MDISDVYIIKQLHIIHPELKISKDALLLLQNYMKSTLVVLTGKIKTVSEAPKVINKLFAGNLAKYAIAEGSQAKGSGVTNYITAVVDYLASELLRVSGNEAVDRTGTEDAALSTADIGSALKYDKDLATTLGLPIKLTKVAKKPSRKVTKKPSRKVTKKPSRKVTKKPSRKVTKKPTGFTAMTVTELKHEAKKRGLSGYSKLRKDELIKLLQTKKKSYHKVVTAKKSKYTTMTVAKLKQKAKKRGLSGYSKLRKAELIKLLT